MPKGSTTSSLINIALHKRTVYFIVALLLIALVMVFASVTALRAVVVDIINVVIEGTGMLQTMVWAVSILIFKRSDYHHGETSGTWPVRHLASLLP